MTNEGLDPAPPGTAARCEVCLRESGFERGQCFVGESSGLIEEVDCFRIGFERLKAENASLRESLDAEKTRFILLDAMLQAKKNQLARAEQMAAGSLAQFNSAEECARKHDARATAAEQRAEAAEKRVQEQQCFMDRAFDQRDAAEQRNTALEGALRSIIIRCREGDKRTDWLPIIDGIARAALHDEERRPQEEVPLREEK